MILSQSFIARDRRQAGLLLADKLQEFKGSNAIVIAVSSGGAIIGFHLAKKLNLPFDVVPCKKIDHPGDKKKTIGSISADEVVIDEGTYDIPGEYIHHQIVLNQNALKAQLAFYNSRRDNLIVEGKTIILVDDILISANSLLASIKGLRRQRPKEIVVVASAVSPEAIKKLSFEPIEVERLAVASDITPEKFYEEYLLIQDEEVRELILSAMRELNQGYKSMKNTNPIAAVCLLSDVATIQPGIEILIAMGFFSKDFTGLLSSKVRQYGLSKGRQDLRGMPHSYQSTSYFINSNYFYEERE